MLWVTVFWCVCVCVCVCVCQVEEHYKMNRQTSPALQHKVSNRISDPSLPPRSESFSSGGIQQARTPPMHRSVEPQVCVLRLHVGVWVCMCALACDANVHPSWCDHTFGVWLLWSMWKQKRWVCHSFLVLCWKTMDCSLQVGTEFSSKGVLVSVGQVTVRWRMRSAASDFHGYNLKTEPKNVCWWF